MAVERDPRKWTKEQRAAYLANELSDLLRTVPTEQSLWADGIPATRERELQAQEISDRMAAVEKAGRDRPADG